MIQSLSPRFGAQVLPQVYSSGSGKPVYTAEQCPEGYVLIKDLKELLSGDAFSRKLMDNRYTNTPGDDFVILRDNADSGYFRIRHGHMIYAIGRTLEEARKKLPTLKSSFLSYLAISLGGEYGQKEKRITFLTEFFVDEKHAQLQAQALAYLNTRPDIPVKLQSWQEAIPKLKAIAHTLEQLRNVDAAAVAAEQPNPEMELAYIKQNGVDPLQKIMDMLKEQFSPPE